MILCMTRTISKMLSMNEPLYHVQGHIKMLWDNCLLHLTMVKSKLSWWTCWKQCYQLFIATFCHFIALCEMKLILENITKHIILQNLGFNIRPNNLECKQRVLWTYFLNMFLIIMGNLNNNTFCNWNFFCKECNLKHKNAKKKYIMHLEIIWLET